MGKLKSFFHDEICAMESGDPDPTISLLSRSPLTTPTPPMHVLMESNSITGTATPVHVYAQLDDAQHNCGLLNMGKRLGRIDEGMSYYVVTGVSCIE
jgi:hypothetical protein